MRQTSLLIAFVVLLLMGALLICSMVASLIAPWGAPPTARAASDPGLSAMWDSPSSATVQWYQETRGCLSVEHATGETVFILCSERYPATVRIELGHGLTDGTARPQVGDVYVLVTNGQTYRALLVARQWRVYVSTIRR